MTYIYEFYKFNQTNVIDENSPYYNNLQYF